MIRFPARLATAILLALAPPAASAIPLEVGVFNGAGERIRGYAREDVGLTVSQFAFTFTCAGSCASCSVNTGLPFSPDGDCANDVLVFRFPGLADPVTGGPYDRFAWDGRNHRGEWVPNGSYLALATTTSTTFAGGGWVTLQQTIALTALRVQAVGRIYNSAGVLVIELPAVANPGVTGAAMTPAVFEPEATGTNVAEFHLLDATGAVLGLLTWNGRDAGGTVVENGAYLLNLEITAADGTQSSITMKFSVSHGPISLISDVHLIPNPVSADAEKLWLSYVILSPNRLKEVWISAYTLDGNLVSRFDAAGQQSPADPLDASGNGFGTAFWNLTNDRGHRVAPGLYLLSVEAVDTAGQRHRVKRKVGVN